MSEEKQALHSEKVQAGRFSYCFDVREAANGSVFLSLTQCRRLTSEGQDRTAHLYVFEDGMGSFRKALWAALRSMQKEVEGRRDGDLTQLRTTYPRAFEKWTPDEEAELRKLFAEHGTPAAVAPHTGRTERAVALRLQKLGLIQVETRPQSAPGPEQPPALALKRGRE
jgi:hypothetical protein